jgi:hypothetical protein
MTCREELIDEGINIALGVVQAVQSCGPSLTSEQFGVITSGFARAYVQDASAEEIRAAIRRAHNDLAAQPVNLSAYRKRNP